MLITNQHMTESEPMAEARRNLDRRLLEAPVIRDALTQAIPLNSISIASSVRAAMLDPQSASALTTTAAKPAPSLRSS